MRAARFFLCLFATFAICLFTAVPSYAQNYQQPTKANSLVQFETNPDVPRNIHTLTQGVTLGLASSVSCLLFGIDPLTQDQRCLAPDPQTNKLGYVKRGSSALGFMNSMIASLFNPPIHTGEYVSYLSQNFGLAKTAYAQTGSGFDGIKPIIGLWIAFRNITYLLFIIVFTVIGIAIMLRVKIDPRTVMSIENQIPKLILGIILVTLSFPIAGFLIDFMWIVTYLIIAIIRPFIDSPTSMVNIKEMNIFDNPAGFVGSVHLQANLLGGNVGIPGVLAIMGNCAGMVKDIIVGWFPQTGVANTVLDVLNFVNIFTWPIKLACTLPAVGQNVGEVCKYANDPIQYFFGALGGLIAFLILGGMLFFALFRLWISLLKAYISILLAIVLAPFWIVAGALPGSPLGFGAWIRSLLSNLLAFPAAIAMLMLGFAFMQAFSANPQGMFTPPLLGLTPDSGVIGTIIGIGTILLPSQVTNILKDAFKSPSLKYTSAIGQSFGAATGSVKGVAGTLGTGYFKTPEFGKRGGIGAVVKRIIGS